MFIDELEIVMFPALIKCNAELLLLLTFQLNFTFYIVRSYGNATVNFALIDAFVLALFKIVLWEQ